MEKNSTLIPNSRYVSGGITEVNDFALEWWERTPMTIDNTDRVFVVDQAFMGRIDLIAQQFLGNSRLWWVIAQYNGLLDPHAEVSEGRVLRVPSKERVQAMLTGKLGGFASTREVKLTNITAIV